MRKATSAAIKSVFRLIGPDVHHRILSSIDPTYFRAHDAVADIGGAVAKFHIPNQLAAKRAHRILTKEPDTIAWLDTIGSDDVLWDIGANVGTYTVYAAIKRQCRVFAFEPAAGNYYLLNRNIELNGLHRKATAYCVALSKSEGVGELSMPTTLPSASYAQYGRRVGKEVFAQGSIAVTVDALVKSLPSPTHMKIDVDGLEQDILLGATHTLQSVKSVIVERDFSDRSTIEEAANFMARFGLIFKNEEAAPSRAVKNCVFTRI